MKLTDKRIVKALLSQKHIRYDAMPENMFIMAELNTGNLIVVENGKYICQFKPKVFALAQDNWYII